MLTEKDYCDYDTCVALLKLGFPRWELPYDIFSQKYCLRLYEAQKFLREEKDMNVNIRAFIENGWYYTIQDCKGNPICSQLTLTEELYSTYEEALSEGVCKATEILKILKEE